MGVSGLILLVLARCDTLGTTATIEKGTRFLLREQRHAGLIGPASSDARCNQSVCTLALLEVHARQYDHQVKMAIDKALDCLLTFQVPSGEWNGSEALELWTLEALVRARDLGWRGVSGSLSRALERAERRVGASPVPKKFRDGSLVVSARASEQLYSALAVLLLENSADTIDTRQQALDVVARSLVRSTTRSVYKSYLLSRAISTTATLAVQKLGENHRELVRRQIAGGTLAGSWNSDGELVASGGRLATTALAALSLQVGRRDSAFFSTGY